MDNNLPKIIFRQMPLELETEMFFDFLEGNWKGMITGKHSEFLEINNIKPKKAQLGAIRNQIIKIRTRLGGELDQNLEKIKKNWQKIETKVFKTLSDIIHEDWSKKEVIAYISLNPICPRYLDTMSFVVTYDRKDANIIITHELSHFLYFKKLKEDFPEISRDKYESPHKEWILSEIITPIILNDPRVVKIIGPGAGFYDKHKELKINGESFIELVQKLYQELVIQKNDFFEFNKKALELLKELK